jgi:uncharacterized protein YndB with AHSA1/START domain
MALDVVTEVVIDRPREEVATYAADPGQAPRWYANIDTVRWQTEPPLALGSRVTFSARFMGRRLEYTYEIVELVPGERLVMRAAEGPFPMETTYTWEPTPSGGTRMTLRNRGGPGGIARLFDPIAAGAVRRATRRDLTRLKEILETRGDEEKP